MVEISLIVCKTIDNGIGYHNNLLFKIKKDMDFFKTSTITTNNSNKQNAILMGYNTWESIPNKFKPLNNRINIVITDKHYDYMIQENNLKYNNQLVIYNNLSNSIKQLKQRNDIDNLFIIGGQNIYNSIIQMNIIDKLYLTTIFYKLPEHFIDTYINTINIDLYKLDKSSEIYKEDIYIYPLKKYDLVEYQFNIYSKI